MEKLFSYLILICFFASCESEIQTQKIKSLKQEEPILKDIIFEESDSIPKIKSLDSNLAFPKIFEAIFKEGTEIKQWGVNLNLTTKNIGSLKIPSGKIIVGDPIISKDLKPFIHDFPKGNFPVEIAIISIEKDARIGFVRVRFSQEKIKKWEFTRQENQEKISIKEDEIYGFSVDASMALIMDKESSKIYEKNEVENFQKIFDLTNSTWAKLYEFENYNLVTFATGYGDGFYSSYIGLDKNGNICQLLCDFQLINWWLL